MLDSISGDVNNVLVDLAQGSMVEEVEESSRSSIEGETTNSDMAHQEARKYDDVLFDDTKEGAKERSIGKRILQCFEEKSDDGAPSHHD